MHKILYNGSSPSIDIEQQINTMRKSLIDAIQEFYVAGGYPDPPTAVTEKILDLQEEVILSLRLQIKKLRRDLDDMKTSYNQSLMAYHHLSYLISANTNFSEHQQNLLSNKQESCLTELKATHPIQQKMFEAKIAGLEREVEILSSGEG
ncbi:MAG: hypothetical protein IPP69_16115 [Flavobacteriales bacterium]|nr:hypothetical protein [Flavobacteriales bacterium]